MREAKVVDGMKGAKENRNAKGMTKTPMVLCL